MPLNKYLSSAGLCSRRQAVEFIKDGQVTVNGIIVKSPETRVGKTDRIYFKNKFVKPDEKIYILLNKPKDYVTTLSDERNRKTVVELVKGLTKTRVNPVGRLDRATTGLLLLTNDGELTQNLAHPRNEVKKVYSVVLDRPLKIENLLAIRAGLELKDGIAQIDKISFVQGSKKNHVKVQLHSGKNRIVRRLFEHFDYKVLKLDRINYAGLTRRGLPIGTSRFLTKQELENLQKSGAVVIKKEIKRVKDSKSRRYFTKNKSKRDNTSNSRSRSKKTRR
ncbi:rRNA pseudouridine synthase [bacterium]|nr:rRNA pseudouridine synthase [bacterium]